jgi:ATP-dependent Clp protease ATP-binding subunit ClpA
MTDTYILGAAGQPERDAVLSSELEFCLNQAFHQARSARHEFITAEHLMLAILDTPKVREVLEGCGADTERLGADLRHHLDESTPRMDASDEREVQPSIGFQRVLQRAVFHVQSSGKKEVGVLNVLVAIFSEKQSHAVFLLARAGHADRRRELHLPRLYTRDSGATG